MRKRNLLWTEILRTVSGENQVFHLIVLQYGNLKYKANTTQMNRCEVKPSFQTSNLCSVRGLEPLNLTFYGDYPVVHLLLRHQSHGFLSDAAALDLLKRTAIPSEFRLPARAIENSFAHFIFFHAASTAERIIFLIAILRNRIKHAQPGHSTCNSGHTNT